MTKPMTPAEAVEVLKKRTNEMRIEMEHGGSRFKEEIDEIDAALDALDGIHIYGSETPLWHIAHPPVKSPDERRAICGSGEQAFGVWEKLPVDDWLDSCCPKCNAIHVRALKKMAEAECKRRNEVR